MGLRVNAEDMIPTGSLSVEEEVAGQIDQLVEEQVALCLQKHIPQELQDELAVQKHELQEVRRQLHNS